MTPTQSPDPLQSIIDLAEKVLNDAKAMADEGTTLARDAGGVVIESLQFAKNKLDVAAEALGKIGKKGDA